MSCGLAVTSSISHARSCVCACVPSLALCQGSVFFAGIDVQRKVTQEHTSVALCHSQT